MKKVLLAAATVAMLFATSCKKDVNAPEDIRLGENEFFATIDNGAVPQNAPAVRDGMNTMTTIDGERRVFWETDDVIKINGVDYKAKTTGNPVIFEPADPSTVVDESSKEYHAYYPASIASCKLPEEQTYTADNNVSNLPMYALGGEDKQLTFHNICAVLKIVVPADFAGATKIEVSSDQQMNGGFTVVDNAASMDHFAQPDESVNENKVSIKKSGDAAFATGDVVYIAVPAGEYTNFTVAAVKGDGTVLWDKTLETCALNVNTVYPINATPENPLCFTAVDAAGATVTFTLRNNFGETIEYYSTGEENPGWQTYTSGTPITLAQNQKVYFRASANHNTAFSLGQSGWSSTFSITGNVKASGNIMSLYGPNCPDIELPENAFSFMFANCNTLTTAPELPATTLANFCYYHMFENCSTLTTAPKLPVTNLAGGCYECMFGGCTALTTAPVLPAETLVARCYNSMFNGCSNLKEVYIYATDGYNTNKCLDSWLLNAGTMATNPTVHCKTSAKSAIQGTVLNWSVVDDITE